MIGLIKYNNIIAKYMVVISANIDLNYTKAKNFTNTVV